VLRINEVAAEQTGGCDLVEFRVLSGGTLGGMSFNERISNIFDFPSIDVATNDLIVLHIDANDANCGNGTSETTAKNEFPQATVAQNYDDAWDFYSTDGGLTSTDNVFSVVNRAGDIEDAIFAARDACTTAAGGTETRAAQVATANEWENVGGGQPAGGYIDADFCANAAPGLDQADVSIQRVDDGDTNTAADWTTAPQAFTFGALNAGQTAF
jgi:methionine-rich copper-binding protein CopC